MNHTFTDNNSGSTCPTPNTVIPYTGSTTQSSYTSHAPIYYFTSPPSYKFEFTSPITKKLVFLRMPCGFSKLDFIRKLGHLPDDVFIVNCSFDTLSNSIIIMLTSEKFLVREEGDTIPEIIVTEESWDYKTRFEFAKKIEERY